MVLVSVAAVVVAALAVFSATRPPAASGALIPPTTVYSADLTEGASLGSTRAPVVIQLYADFQCPACKQFVVQQLPRLVSDFVRPGTVRIEAEDIDILGSGAVNESVELAAGAYCAAEQNRYWQYHDLAFWNQGRENRGDHDVAFIERVASQAGVDVPSWQTCFARSDVRQPARDRTAAAIARGITSTPTLVVNGHALAGGMPDYASLSAMIRQLVVSASSAPGSSTGPSPLAATSAVPS